MKDAVAERQEEMRSPTLKEEAKLNATDKTSADSLYDLLKKNLKWSEVIYEQNRKLGRRLTWLVVENYLRLFIIVAPLVLAIIYLPPLLEQFWAQYGQLLGGAATGGDLVPGSQLNDILSQISGQKLEEVLRQFQKQ